MKYKHLIFATAISMALVVSLQSCRKEAKQTLETIVSAEDNSTAENEMTSMFDVADDFSSNDSRVRSGNTILPNGAVVNFTDSSFNDGDGIECTIDFGPLKTSSPKGVLCKDGRYRAGILHIKMNKRYIMDSAEIQVYANESDNYYGGSDGMNMTKISGNITILKINSGLLKLSVTNAKAVNDKGTVTWQSERTITKTVDNGPGLLGDEFTVTGSASGVNRNGENFTITIDQALEKKIELGCARTFIAGKITLTNTSTGKTIKIDYDPYNNKACDLVAKATINSKEYYYTVR